MSRARNIKPGFFKNDILAECHPLTRILFAGLWCEADREGRMEDRPKRLKAECLPYDDCDIEELLGELSDRGFIVRYVVEGKPYIAVTEFTQHQNPHQREVPSVIPAPTDTRHNLGSDKAQPRLDPAEKCTGSARLVTDSPSLVTDSPSLKPERGTASPTKSRGTRLSTDWTPPAELLAWVKEERPAVDLPNEIAKFRDYWIAKAGQPGVKLDWDATFRNWIRSAREGPPQRAPSKPPIAQNFSQKTYTGTPDHELPEFLRTNQA